jgi:hypothetical protein
MPCTDRDRVRSEAATPAAGVVAYFRDESAIDATGPAAEFQSNAGEEAAPSNAHQHIGGLERAGAPCRCVGLD